MRITVPTAPEGAKSWRKTITGLDHNQRGGAIVVGEFLSPGDEVDVPDGTLIVAVDKVTRGYEYSYHGDRVPIQDATVAAFLVGPDGISALWSRHYKLAKSAFGTTTTKKLAALLEQHPAPSGEIAVAVQAQRPNRREGTCRWCHTRLPAGRGHLVGHGDVVAVECWRECPDAYSQAGETCGRCGRTTVTGTASRVMVREGAGRRETRHYPRLDCVNQPQESHEEYLVRSAAVRAAEQRAAAERRAEQQRKDAAAAARAEARQRRADEAHAAEQARIAGLAETGRTSTNLNDKRIGDGMRAALDEITVSLEDGTTTTRWAVRTYGSGTGWTGEDYDPDEGAATEYPRKAEAQAAYRGIKFQPAVRRHEDVDDGTGRQCAECGQRRGTIPRTDSSGIPGMVCPCCDRYESFQLSFA